MAEAARAEVFDLAVSRALSYALKLGLDLQDAEALRQGLELWYLKTRFAYRTPLEAVVEALKSYPGGGSWRGGPGGGWVKGGPARP